MLTEFEKGSLLHLVMVLACYAVMGGAVWLGRRGRERAPDLERALRIGWVVFVLLTQVPWQVWQNLPGNGDYRYTLPLHLCDIVVLVIPFALLTRSRPARSVLYFWGIGLTFCALLMPALREGPSQFSFWMFWIGHTQIVGSAFYLPAVLGYRPSADDLRTALLVNCAHIAVVAPFNVALGADYAGAGPDPSSTAIFGPWPLRLAVLAFMEGLLFVVLWLPWEVARRWRRPT